MDEWTSDGNPHAVKNLREGEKYVLEEVSAPSGYALASPIEFTPAQRDTEVVMADGSLGLRIKKSDSNSNAVDGARLQLLKDGSVVDEWTTSQSEEYHEAVGVQENTEYVLHEEAAPEGYVLAGDRTVKVETGLASFEFPNYRVYARKTDENGNELAGAQLRVRDAGGAVMDEWTSDGNPHAVKNLREGEKYVLEEVSAPNGYALADPVEFTPGEQDTEVVMEDQKMDILIRKLDMGTNPIEGAVLQVLDNDRVVDEWTTTLEEPAHFVNGIVSGKTYVVREISAPFGYVKAKDSTFKAVAGVNEVPVRDYRISALKVDEDGNVLFGASLVVLDQNGAEIDAWTSTEERHYINGLIEGEEYTLVEKAAPFGYAVAKPVKFKADSDAEIIMKDKKLIIYVSVLKRDADTKMPLAGAQFTVYRKADDQIALKTDGSAAVVETGEDGKAFVELYWNEENRDGYYLMETSAPQGYLNDHEGERRDIVPDESYTFKNTDEKFSFTYEDRINTILKLRKRDRETDDRPQNEATFAGAEYTLYDDSNAAIHVFIFDVNGITEDFHCLRRDKTYTLRETKAPRGYVLDPTIYDIDFSTVELTDGYYEITRRLDEDVYEGSFKIHKVISQSDSSEIAKPEQGAQFLAIAKKYVDRYESFEEAAVHTDEYLENEWSLIETDENGDGYSGKLAYGSYVVRQTKASDETQMLQDSFEFTVDEPKQKEIVYHIINEGNPYRLRLVKLDDKTGKMIVSDSARFKIFCLKDGQGDEVNQYVTQKIGSYVFDTFQTSSNVKSETESGVFYAVDSEKGMVTLPLTISAGLYRIEEIKSPQGYTLLQEPIEIEIKETRVAELDNDNTPLFTVKAIDQRIFGVLTVNKHVEEYPADATVIVPDCLSQIEFTLFADEDIINPLDGTIVLKKGEAFEAKYANSDGTLVFKDIPLGSYVLRETKTADGLVKDNEDHPIVFKQENDWQQFYEYSLDLENYVTKTEISKKDVTGDEELCGAQLAVVDIETGETVDSWISTEKPHMICGLKANGTYRFDEVMTPRDEQGRQIGYTTAASVEFTVDAEGKVTPVAMVDKYVEMSKMDIGGDELPGAEITVFDMDGNVVDEWISSDVPHKIANLIEGNSYILHENTAPLGYVKATDIPFTVDYEKKNEIVVMTDKIIEVSKVDVAGDELPGAKMTVYDESGTVVDEWVSGDTPHRIANIEEGKSYVLHEDTAPLGYAKATDIPFTVGEEKKNETIVMKDKVVLIDKTDLDGNEIEGALMQVKDSEGNVVDEWVSTTEPHKVSGLRVGERYVMSEKAAPKGYYYCSEASFLVNDDGIGQKETMIDNVIEYEILKVDDKDGSIVKGVTLRLRDITDPSNPIDVTGIEGQTEDGAWVTTEEPIVLRGVLEAEHTYELEESEYVAGVYQATSIQFTVQREGNDPVVITMVDETVAASVLKTDEKGNPLAGARLQVIDEDGNVVYEFTSGSDIHGTDISRFVKGEQTYTLHEVSAPVGYGEFEDITFTVTGKENTAQVIRAVDKIVSIVVRVVKMDANDKNKTLAGAQFSVFNKSDHKVAKDINGNACDSVTGNDGIVEFTLPYNPDGYYVKEIKAPAGYYLVNERSGIEFKEGEIYTVQNPYFINVFDKPFDTPDTSDSGLRASLIAFGISTVVGLGALFFKLRN